MAAIGWSELSSKVKVLWITPPGSHLNGQSTYDPSAFLNSNTSLILLVTFFQLQVISLRPMVALSSQPAPGTATDKQFYSAEHCTFLFKRQPSPHIKKPNMTKHFGTEFLIWWVGTNPLVGHSHFLLGHVLGLIWLDTWFGYKNIGKASSSSQSNNNNKIGGPQLWWRSRLTTAIL